MTTERITRVLPQPTEGLTRCPCGVKYWHGNTCHGCGERWKPARCEFRTTCEQPARYYAMGPAAGDWACRVCEKHLPPTWTITDRYY